METMIHSLKKNDKTKKENTEKKVFKIMTKKKKEEKFFPEF